MKATGIARRIDDIGRVVIYIRVAANYAVLWRPKVK